MLTDKRMQEPITITWSINGESDYNELLQCAAKLFQKRIEALERDKEKERELYERQNTSYANISQNISQIKAVLNRHSIKCGEKDLQEAISTLDGKLNTLEKSEKALNSFRSMLSKDIDGWEIVISEFGRINDRNNRINAILKSFEIEPDKELLRLSEWMNGKCKNEELSIQAKKNLSVVLAIKDDNPNWEEIEEKVAELNKMKSQYDSLIKRGAAKDEYVSARIYERIDQIEELIQSDINSCDNQALAEYIQDFTEYNKQRKLNKEQKFIKRDFSGLLPIFNLVWWEEQEELKPFLIWCKSITEIGKRLYDICLLLEVIGYRITVPCGRMSKDNMSNYKDVSANPERYCKIFSGSNYPEEGCYCMIGRLALFDVNTKEAIEGECFRFHK